MPSPFEDFLNASPESGYFGYLAQMGLPKGMQNFYQTQFQPQQSKYMGQLGQQILQGGAPTMNWTDYLKDLFAPQGGAYQQWQGMSPWARGEDTGRFAPPVQIMPYAGRGRTNPLGSGYGGF